MYYAFEPLQFTKDRSISDFAKIDYLKQVLDCKFKDVIKLLNDDWTLRTFCAKPGFCGGRLVSKWEEKCKTYPHRAAKVIQISSINRLETLMNSGVKVIHIVRDPRGTITSRLRLHVGEDGIQNAFMNDPKLIQSVATLCHSLFYDHMYIERLHNEQFIKENYMFLRYEDLATNPEGQVKRISEFLHLDMTKSFEMWERMTKIKSNQQGDTYSTHRINSQATALRWKDVLPHTVVFAIEKVCAHSILKLGYTLMHHQPGIRSNEDIGIKPDTGRDERPGTDLRHEEGRDGYPPTNHRHEGRVGNLGTNQRLDIGNRRYEGRIGHLGTDIKHEYFKSNQYTDLKPEEGRTRILNADLKPEEGMTSRLDSDLKPEDGRARILDTDIKPEEGGASRLDTDLKPEEGRASRLDTDLNPEEGRARMLDADLKRDEGIANRIDTDSRHNKRSNGVPVIDLKPEEGKTGKLGIDLKLKENMHNGLATDNPYEEGRTSTIITGIMHEQGIASRPDNSLRSKEGKAGIPGINLKYIKVRAGSIDTGFRDDSKVGSPDNGIKHDEAKSGLSYWDNIHKENMDEKPNTDFRQDTRKTSRVGTGLKYGKRKTEGLATELKVEEQNISNIGIGLKPEERKADWVGTGLKDNKRKDDRVGTISRQKYRNTSRADLTHGEGRSGRKGSSFTQERIQNVLTTFGHSKTRNAHNAIRTLIDKHTRTIRRSRH